MARQRILLALLAITWLLLLPKRAAAFHFAACKEQVTLALRNGSVTMDNTSIFCSGSTLENPILTLRGCTTYCAGRYHHSGPGIVASKLIYLLTPVLLLINSMEYLHMEVGPFKVILHLLGDPIGFTRAVLERLQAWTTSQKRAELLWPHNLSNVFLSEIESASKQSASFLRMLATTLSVIDQQFPGEQDAVEFLRGISREFNEEELHKFVLQTAIEQRIYTSRYMSRTGPAICICTLNVILAVLSSAGEPNFLLSLLATNFIPPVVLSNLTRTGLSPRRARQIVYMALPNRLRPENLKTYESLSHPLASRWRRRGVRFGGRSAALTTSTKQAVPTTVRQVDKTQSFSYPCKQAQMHLFLQSVIPPLIPLLCALVVTWPRPGGSGELQPLVIAVVAMTFLLSYISTQAIQVRASPAALSALESPALAVKDLFFSVLWLLLVLYSGNDNLGLNVCWINTGHIPLNTDTLFYKHIRTASLTLFVSIFSLQLSVFGLWVYNNRKGFRLIHCSTREMREWSEAKILDSFPRTGENGLWSKQFALFRKRILEEDFGSEVVVASTASRLQDPQFNGDSKKDGFSIVGHSEPLSISDRVKNYIQAFTSMPIIWWPLSDPRRPLERGKARTTWQCASCSMHLSLDLAASITEALDLQPFHKQAAAGAPPLEGDLHLDSDDLLLPGRDEEFDHEERDKTMSQCSTLVDSDALNEAPGDWQQKLAEYCKARDLEHPLYSLVSDKRGGRTAWSCILSVAGNTYPARYWYGGQYVHNAKEDAADVALQYLGAPRPATQQPIYRQPVPTSASGNDNSRGSTGDSTSSSSADSMATSAWSDSSSKSRRSHRTQRAYPSSHVDILAKTRIEVGESPRKWVHWCVDATNTRLHEICVEAQTGAKRGCEFINELIDSYRRLRGIRWWLSLTDCATVKVVKFIRLLDEKDFVKCGPEKVNLDEIRRTPEYDITTGSIPDEDLHLAWVESTLAHYIMHQGNYIIDTDIDDIISGLPKKTKGCIGKKARSVGYGIRGVHGWSLAKFLYMLVISTGIGLIFFVYWLVQHPGDIQNASVPYFMLMAAIGGFVALPDLYMG